MSAARDPYVKVYYRIADDPRFEHVFGNDAALAAWLRLLLIADGAWPATAHIPRSVKASALRVLVDAGLIDVAGDRYRVHGMDAERAKRSEHASQASRTRWTSNADSNAPGIPPSKAQTMPLNSDELNSSKRSSSQTNSPPAGASKNGSKDRENDEERLARYISLRDDESKNADIRHAADTEVKRLTAGMH